ncbi:MAG: molybdopterin molybdotransferase MoeA [Trueperaceae bacterium]
MIVVSEADRILAGHASPGATCDCPLESATGRVLREEIRADRDQPPYHRVTMDGIALSTASLGSGSLGSGSLGTGRRVLRRRGVQAAGQPPLRLEGSGDCIEVMTGAVLPLGCDAVIRIEDVEVEGQEVVLREGVEATAMQNVHARGSDCRAGEVVIESGVRLTAAQVGIAAAMGKGTLRVSALPRIAVVSTGDELVAVASEPAEYQVRRSNAYAIDAALGSRGYQETVRCHLADDKATLSSELGALLTRCDMLILSGGVSMGKFDFVPEVLAQLGVQEHLHWVRQRPGKPMWFGTRGGKAVFALPGNPVSTLTCLYRYVLPFLERAAGVADLRPPTVTISHEISGLAGLTRFLPVALDPAGARQASAVESNTSGDFLSLGRSDGFVEIGADVPRIAAGSDLPFYAWAGHASSRSAVAGSAGEHAVGRGEEIPC